MIKRIIQVIWIALALGVLCVALPLYEQESKKDANIFFVYGMLILTVPIGYIVIGFLVLAVGLDSDSMRFLQNSPLKESVALVFLWLLLVGAGYWQWFCLLPNGLKLILSWSKRGWQRK